MSTGDIIGIIFCIPLIGMLYVLVGGLFHPNSKKRWVNALVIAFWPIVLIVGFITFPLILLESLSKTKEETEKELTEWCRSEGNK